MFKAEFFNKFNIRRRKTYLARIETNPDFGKTDYLTQENQLIR
jgi:hypothetical protein